MPEVEGAPAVDAAAVTGADEVDAVEPADLDGYQKLVEKLRGENKRLKADRTPQDEKDARTIAALKRENDALKPKASEYDRIAEASKTAEERAQEALKAAQDRAAAATQRVARAEVKAALAGLVDDPDSIIEDLNLSRFVNDDGDVNEDAVAALKSKYAGFAGKRGPRPDLSQGSAANGRSVVNPAAEFASILQSQLGSRG